MLVVAARRRIQLRVTADSDHGLTDIGPTI
jgi:hypothetical protein